jgi:hypothetical protein
LAASKTEPPPIPTTTLKLLLPVTNLASSSKSSNWGSLLIPS